MRFELLNGEGLLAIEVFELGKGRQLQLQGNGVLYCSPGKPPQLLQSDQLVRLRVEIERVLVLKGAGRVPARR